MEASLRKGNVVSQESDDVFEQTPVVLEGCGGSAVPLSNPSLVRSEKGQQARNAYRSSGYGTGSGDNTSGSASFQISSEHPQHPLSDEACAAVPQTNLIPDLSKGEQKCVENDFKPRSGALYSEAIRVSISPAVHNPTKQEVETRLCTNQVGHTALSLSIKEAGRINVPKQPSVCTHEPNISTETAVTATQQTFTVSHQQDSTTSSNQAMEATFQSLHCNKNVASEKITELNLINGNIATHTKAQQQQQKQPQVVNSVPLAETTPRHANPQHCLPANCTLESSQSGIDAPADNSVAKLDARTKPRFHRQDELQDFGDIAGTLECSTEDEQDNSRSYDHASNVQMSAQPTGHTLSCTDARFMSGENDTSSSFYLMRKEFAVLMDMRTEIMYLSEHQRLLLEKAYCHLFYQCSHPKCPFPCCWDNMDECPAPEEGMQLMKQWFENYAEYFSLFSSPVEEFMKLNNSFELDSLPLEGKHWERLSMLKNSRKTVLVSPIISEFSSEFKYWVIKKQRLGTDHSHHWDVYSRLRDVNHRSIATMLWAARFKNHLLICHVFENLSLRDCLHDSSWQQLGLTTICQILQQMMSAVSYLNNLRIVYLYWISKNILVTCQARESFCVKISNFSCSVPLDNYDGGQLYLTLPPSIMPPELRTNSTVDLLSDVWGLGCMLYEIATGKQVWHEHRHLSDGDLQVLLGSNPVPEIPSTYPQLISLFRTCWEIDFNRRKTVRDLELLLAKIYL